MNFVLIENVNGKVDIVWENNFEILPSDAISFTYYQQGNRDENGMVNSFEYRIGVPIEFIDGSDEYIELESTLDGFPNNKIYSLYIYDEKRVSQQIKRIIKPINKNTTLVSNFSELEEVFATIIKKEQVRKR